MRIHKINYDIKVALIYKQDYYRNANFHLIFLDKINVLSSRVISKQTAKAKVEYEEIQSQVVE